MPVPRLAVRRQRRQLHPRARRWPEGAKRIPATARVAAYPAVEHWGHVWTCLDEPVGGLPDPPEFAALELGEWVAGPILHSTIGLAATTENFRDVAHFPFVHRGTMGEVPHVVEPLDVRRDGVEVWMTRRVEAQDGAAEWSDDGDAWMRYHTIAPGVSIIVYEYDDTSASASCSASRRRSGPTSARSSGASPTTRRSRG